VLLRLAPLLGPGGERFALRCDPERVSDLQFQPPSRLHWFGTDVHGRDLFSRVMAGARISLFVGVAGACVSVLVGVGWGAVAGYAGGKTDAAMMRFVDVLYAMPTIIFVIVVMTTMEELWTGAVAAMGMPGWARAGRLWLLLLVLGGVSWLTMARIVRGQVLSLRERPFVEASRALGASPVRILARHIIPNTIGVVLVYATLTVPAVILYESFLSYLGLGVQPPMASWGSLLAEGADQLNPFRVYWWLIVFPAATLVLALLALNFVGDGLRAAWDPREE
jgi:peptide/nickel transport system permease protein/oligopeptide transport system permease protein